MGIKYIKNIKDVSFEIPNVNFYNVEKENIKFKNSILKTQI